MPADIVKGIDLARAVADDDEVVAGDVVAEPVAGLLEARVVGHHEPPPREDGAPLEVVKVIGAVPRGRQGADGLLLVDHRAVCWFRVGAEAKVVQH